MLFGKAQRGHARLFQQRHEPPRVVGRKHPYQRDVERTFDRPVRRDRPVECLVVVLRREAVQVQGHVRNERAGEQLPVVQHGGIKEGLQDAARAARRSDDVYLVPFAGIGLEGDVSRIGEHLARFGIGDEGGQVMDVVGGIVAGVAVDELLRLALQHPVDGGRDARSRSVGRQPFEQVRGFVGQRHGRFGKRFEERQPVFGFVQYPSLL